MLPTCFGACHAEWGTPFQVGLAKMMHSVVTLLVFVPFLVWVLGRPRKRDYQWAGLYLAGAAHFVFGRAA